MRTIIKINHYDAVPGSRVQMARDCFILSFCLMGMNSVDMYQATKLEEGTLKYKLIILFIALGVAIPNVFFRRMIPA